MSQDPTQFFDKAKVALAPVALGTDRAVYEIPGTSTDGEPLIIAVECVDGGGNVPRNATSFQHIADKNSIEKEFKAVTAVAESVLNSLKALQPGSVEIEFGVELGGQWGVPLITKGEAKANFKVTLKWTGEK